MKREAWEEARPVVTPPSRMKREAWEEARTHLHHARDPPPLTSTPPTYPLTQARTHLHDACEVRPHSSEAWYA